MVKLLLERQANLDALDQRGYSPLDWAILMGHAGLAALLSQHGANKSVTEVDQPALPGTKAQPAKRQVPVGEAVTGALLDESGQPLAASPTLTVVATQPLYHAVGDSFSPVLETGIKIIDLFAPLKRGGHLGLFTPLSGVGKIVLLNQLIYRMAVFHQGYIVYLGLEEGEYTAASLIQARRGEFGLKENISEERMVSLFGQADSPVQAKQRMAETGLTLAESFRQQGHEVLLVVDSRVALVEGVVPYLRAYAVTTPEAAITTLYHGDFTVGLEPLPLANLDAVITFDLERAMQRLYPAVDPLRSYSELIQPYLVGQDHVEIIAQARRHLQRYRELHYQVEKRGLDSLFYLDQREEDEVIVGRARRLHRFLTQPFFGTEPWTGMPGQYVKIEAALAGCQAILAGQTDDWPEEALYFVGTINQAARNSGTGGSASAR
jgi:F-type H+-transporting ATPase subunit beta